MSEPPFMPEMPEPPVRAVKVVLIREPGINREPDSGPIALVGEQQMPVFRDAMFHSLLITYAQPSAEHPIGALVIGSKVDIVAMAWTCSLTPGDRAMLEGMRITPNFVPDPAIWGEKSTR